MQTHKDLTVWKESRELVTKVYSVIGKFPKEEVFSLTAQIKRSVISIPSNIAEGAARDSNKEYIRFLYIALGSAAELDTQIIMASDLKMISVEDFTEITQKLCRISKMISGLIRFRQSKF
jgi:four helix bundle protein